MKSPAFPGAISLTSIPADRQPMAHKILTAFAAAGFGKFQQAAALADAIVDSGLDAKAQGADGAVGLFQLSQSGFGAGHSLEALEDPDVNIGITILMAKKVPEFASANSLDEAVNVFVRRIIRPANIDVFVIKTLGVGNQLLQTSASPAEARSALFRALLSDDQGGRPYDPERVELMRQCWKELLNPAPQSVALWIIQSRNTESRAVADCINAKAFEKR